ncbi:MAG: DsrE family protein [Desulfobacterales bacterium]|nr:DsrE family protein [Deltaproteobacteria bacterium]NNK93052.1 DsrE family protein [Desulfobacterales bacterium]
MKNFLAWLFLLPLLIVSGRPVIADDNFNNDRALAGVSEANIYFDVSLGDPSMLLLRLDLIDRTISQMKGAGIATQGVVGFRGPASRYITIEAHYVLEEEIGKKVKIQEWIKKLSAAGYTIEQCSIAAKQQGIEHTDVLPEVTIVKNGYISLVGYQLKGFAVIPMD